MEIIILLQKYPKIFLFKVREKILPADYTRIENPKDCPVRYDGNPCREFVKQRIELFSEKYEGQKKTLIYDNAAQFTSIDYSWYDIKGVNICTSAPNMNAFVERLNGTIKKKQILSGLHHHYYRSSA